MLQTVTADGAAAHFLEWSSEVVLHEKGIINIAFV